ncbi:MAG: hypothetical protein Q9177_003804 [Variospora cf. flavescens]
MPDKKGFFTELYELDKPDDSDEDVRGLLSTIQAYFIPNDDVAPARKRRIRKTMERGAAWIKQWDDRITHIIVDKSLSYSDVLKFLKMSSIPSNMAVVNELYPSECVQYQMLVNPSQRLYQVQGFQEKLKPEKGRSFETPSIESLPLKSRKSVAKPSQTPTRTEASDQNEVDRPCAVDATTCPVPEAPVSPYPRLDNRLPDALDKAIEETLAVQDLVSYVAIGEDIVTDTVSPWATTMTTTVSIAGQRNQQVAMRAKKKQR